jgi:hypothetical protein
MVKIKALRFVKSVRGGLTQMRGWARLARREAYLSVPFSLPAVLKANAMAGRFWLLYFCPPERTEVS